MHSDKDAFQNEYGHPSKRPRLISAVHRPFIEDYKSDLSMDETSDDEYFKHLIVESVSRRKEGDDKPKASIASVDLSSLALTEVQNQSKDKNEDTNGNDTEEDSFDEEDDFFGFDEDPDAVDTDGLNQFLDTWKQELTTSKQDNSKAFESSSDSSLESSSRSSSVDEFGDDEMQKDAIRKCKEKWMGKCKKEAKLNASNMAIWA